MTNEHLESSMLMAIENKILMEINNNIIIKRFVPKYVYYNHLFVTVVTVPSVSCLYSFLMTK